MEKSSTLVYPQPKLVGKQLHKRESRQHSFNVLLCEAIFFSFSDKYYVKILYAYNTEFIKKKTDSVHILFLSTETRNISTYFVHL